MRNILIGSLLLLSGAAACSAAIRTIASTVPANGDVNPYGVAVVPVTTGALVQHSILVSNFNDAGNVQGTGTTIVEITPNGMLTPFAQISADNLPGPCPGGVGLTTALVALRSGFVIVGSLPTSNSGGTVHQGCLIVLNSAGTPVATISDSNINGPWDMTAFDMGTQAVLFVSNVLIPSPVSSTGIQGTVLRILLSIPASGAPTVVNETVIGDTFASTLDPAALVIGPTGVGLGLDGTLYVADTLNSRIAAIPNAVTRVTSAGTGATVAQGNALNQPLGLAIDQGTGQIFTVNAGDGNLVQTSNRGVQVAVTPIDVSGMGGGTLFGLALAPAGGIYYVDDGNNTLNVVR